VGLWNIYVAANMYALAPTAAGKLARYTIKAGNYVEEGKTATSAEKR